jgi:hypothetical protein
VTLGVATRGAWANGARLGHRRTAPAIVSDWRFVSPWRTKHGSCRFGRPAIALDEMVSGHLGHRDYPEGCSESTVRASSYQRPRCNLFGSIRVEAGVSFGQFAHGVVTSVGWPGEPGIAAVVRHLRGLAHPASFTCADEPTRRRCIHPSIQGRLVTTDRVTAAKGH